MRSYDLADGIDWDRFKLTLDTYVWKPLKETITINICEDKH